MASRALIDEIQQRVFELVGIAMSVAPQSARADRSQAAIFRPSYVAAGLPCEADQLIDIDRLRIERLAASEGEQAVGEARRRDWPSVMAAVDVTVWTSSIAPGVDTLLWITSSEPIRP